MTMRVGLKYSLKYDLTGSFLMSVLCLIIYSNTLHSPFVFDDLPNITNNPRVRLTNLDLGSLYNGALKSRSLDRPVANFSFAINYYFGRYDPTGYHVFNIVIHLINGILVYFLALIMFKQLSSLSNHPPISSEPQSLDRQVRLVSLFTALVFIAHPIQTQSVTYIVQRMNSMAAMFYLLSFLLYIHGRLAERRWKRWTLFSMCFFSGLMAFGSKQIAATLPFVILLYEWYFCQDLDFAWLKKKLVWLLVPISIFFLLGLIYLGANPFDKIAAGYAHRDFDLGARVLTQFRVVVFYISLLLYPHPSRLNLIHHVETSRSLFDPITTFLSLLLIAGLIGLGAYLARKQRLISFCIFWFFMNLVIESSVIGLEMIYEHRLYLPVFGFSLLLVCLLFRLLSNKRSWAIAISITLVIALATATYSRNRTWRDEITLWSDVVAKNPKSVRGYLNLGAALMAKGRFDEAIVHYYEALKTEPYYVRVHNNLGLALNELGRVDEAISHYQTALKIKPDYLDARVNLARILQDMGKIDEAVLHYQTVLRLAPRSADAAEALNNLAIVLEKQGRLGEAVTHYQAALRINPNQSDVHYNLALALEDMGKLDEAISHYNAALRVRPDHEKAQRHLALAQTISRYSKALETDPNQAEVHEMLAIALAQQGKLDEAIVHFSAALGIRPDNAEAHNNLGIVLAQQGNLKEAITHFSEALRLKPDFAKARDNLEIARQRAKALTGATRKTEAESQR